MTRPHELALGAALLVGAVAVSLLPSAIALVLHIRRQRKRGR